MQLYTHREDVDLVNSHQLAALPAQAVRYVAQDSGGSMDLLKSACPVSLFTCYSYTTHIFIHDLDVRILPLAAWHQSYHYIRSSRVAWPVKASTEEHALQQVSMHNTSRSACTVSADQHAQYQMHT